jgi:hypothetical protein
LAILTGCGGYGSYVPLSAQDDGISSAGYGDLGIDQRVTMASNALDQALRAGTVNKDVAYKMKGQAYQLYEDYEKARRANFRDQKELDRITNDMAQIERRIYRNQFN